MTPDQLKIFCATEEMGKYALERVHVIAGRLYATDSRILVCAPAPEGMADSDATGCPKFEDVPSGCRPSICTTPLPPLVPDARGPDQQRPCESCGDCPECNGTGEEECDLGHMHDCENCDGSGTLGMPDKTKCPECKGAGFTVVAQWKYQRVGDRWLNCFYLDMMARNLTNVRFSLAGDSNRPMFFVADGGVEGALMPLREDRGYEADEYHAVPWR